MTPGSADGEEEAPNPLFIILVAVFCIALIAVAAILIHMGKARSDFRKLSEMVEENATATAAPRGDHAAGDPVHRADHGNHRPHGA